MSFNLRSSWAERIEKDPKGQWYFKRDPAIIAYENKFARELVIRELYLFGEPAGLKTIQARCHYYTDSVKRAIEALRTRDFVREGQNQYAMTYEGSALAESILLSPFANRIFLIAKCCDEIDKLIELVYRPAVKGYELFFQEKNEPKNSIHEDIWENIEFSKLVICDLTGKRPNCFIEYGYAAGKGKQIILCVEESEGKAKNNLLKMPFDTQPQKYSFWRREWLQDPVKYKAELDKFRDDIADRIARKIALIDSKTDI